MHLSGKVAVVTGGASGLGQATVSQLVEAGMKVAIFDLNQVAGTALSEELGESVIYRQVDIAEDESVAAGVNETAGHFGAIHVCVNCAGRGGGATKTLSKSGRFPMALFRNVLEINLMGTFSVLTHCAEVMAENDPDENGERGVIINASSIAAFEGQRGQVAYAASKGGIVGMTVPIARDLSYYGIRMMTIAPGVFDTPILDGIPEELKQSLASNVPFPRRLGAPSEFAALVQHIAQNAYLNGATLRLDGALRMV